MIVAYRFGNRTFIVALSPFIENIKFISALFEILIVRTAKFDGNIFKRSSECFIP